MASRPIPPRPSRVAEKRSMMSYTVPQNPGFLDMAQECLSGDNQRLHFSKGVPMMVLRTTLVAALLCGSPLFWRGRWKAGCTDVPGARFPDAHPPADRRGEARGRRLLVARRQAPRVPERARARQSLLSDLHAQSLDRRHQAHLARHRQDHVRVLPSRHRRDRVRVHARRSEVEAVAGRGAGVSRVGKRAPLLVGLRPGDGHLQLQREDQGAEAADDRARLRRRGQLLAGRPVARLLVDARRATTARSTTRRRSSSRRTRATSPRSTSCAPTASARSG